MTGKTIEEREQYIRTLIDEQTGDNYPIKLIDNLLLRPNNNGKQNRHHLPAGT